LPFYNFYKSFIIVINKIQNSLNSLNLKLQLLYEHENTFINQFINNNTKYKDFNNYDKNR